MQTALNIIDRAFADFNSPAIAFSGGSDSMVLLDLIYSRTPHRPPLVFADSQMEYPGTLPFIRRIAKHYGAKLIIARASRTPLEQWTRCGWPMLGKLAAVLWTRKNKGKGFRINVSGCCKKMKIAPARKAIKAAGCDCQFTGQRGGADDALRGLRAIKDGAVKYIKADDLHIVNPLLGWTDLMIRRYHAQNELPQHPAKAKGAITIGCMYCGGGAQFTNSGYRVLRSTNPQAWRRFMVDWKAGEIILALKYETTLEKIQRAIKKLGGLEVLAKEKPYIFDFVRRTPLNGYNK